jgi:hypothetical protein
MINISKPTLLKGAAYGAAIWYAVAKIIGALKTPLFDASSSTLNLALCFAAFIPISYLPVMSIPPLLGVKKTELLQATLVVLGTANALDGVAFTFFPEVYGLGATSQYLVRPAAIIIWANTWTFVAAMHLHEPEVSLKHK